MGLALSHGREGEGLHTSPYLHMRCGMNRLLVRLYRYVMGYPYGYCRYGTLNWRGHTEPCPHCNTQER